MPIFSTLTAFLLLSMSAFAEEELPALADPLDTDAAYCAKSSPEYPYNKGYPNGWIGEIGGRYFRVCDKPFRTNDDGHILTSWSQVRDPSITAFIGARWPRIDYAMRVIGGTFPWHAPSTQEKMVEMAQVRFGNADYKMYVSVGFPSDLERAQAAIASGRQPNVTSYEFVGPKELGLPDHTMSCNGQVSSTPTEEYSCFIRVNFSPRAALSNDTLITADYNLRWQPGVTYKSNRPDIPFDFDKLPAKARAMQAILEHQDVTENIESLRGKVEVVE